MKELGQRFCSGHSRECVHSLAATEEINCSQTDTQTDRRTHRHSFPAMPGGLAETEKIRNISMDEREGLPDVEQMVSAMMESHCRLRVPVLIPDEATGSQLQSVWAGSKFLAALTLCSVHMAAILGYSGGESTQVFYLSNGIIRRLCKYISMGMEQIFFADFSKNLQHSL